MTKGKKAGKEKGDEKTKAKSGGSKKFSKGDLDKLLAEVRSRAVVKCVFKKPLAGGVPADDKGLEAFAEHHLKLTPGTDEFKGAIKRIKDEEIGERDTTPETGELSTEDVYQVNVLRKSEEGVFLLDHMVKASLKEAATRLGIFQKKRGSKGDLAEMGTILAHGVSLRNEKRPWEIYLTGPQGGNNGTSFKSIQGTVGTPKGKKSISHHTEIAPEGCEFEYELRWLAGKLSAGDIPLLARAAAEIGVGSCRSLGYGRYDIIELEIFD